MAVRMTQPGKGIFFGLALLLAMETAGAASRQHSVLLGPWRTVSVATESGQTNSVRLRKLMVDEKFREHTSGPFHDVSDQLFVIRKAVQLNDSLPQEVSKAPRWVWRMGGWISVDRQTGHVTQLNLPMFDYETSDVSWYRDLAAYCGASDDHSKTYLMVYQIGRRKPLLKKEFTGEPCIAPTWERRPTRVTFLNGSTKSSFVVTARGADIHNEPQDTEQNDEDESE
jgi:hypothetical protein